MSIVLEVEGIDRVLTVLGAVEIEVKGIVKPIFAGATDRVYTNSQANVAVDKGDLKASGKVESGEDAHSFHYDISYGDGQSTPTTYSYPANGVLGAAEADGYAWFIEEGTVKMPAQPYLGPPFEEESQSLTHELGNIFS